jgi:hypothetical protein
MPAAEMPTAHASHMPGTKTSAAVAASSTAAGLRCSDNQASSKHRACQHQQHSSGHDILLSFDVSLRQRLAEPALLRTATLTPDEMQIGASCPVTIVAAP